MRIVPFFFGLCLTNALWAQQPALDPSIFNPAACNCQFDAARLKDTSYTNRLAEPFELIKNTFVYNDKRNVVAIDIINRLATSNNAVEIEKAIAETVSQLNQKPKADGWLDALSVDMRAIVPPPSEQAAVSNWKPYSYRLACLFGERMHGYYAAHPDQALPAHRILYEKPAPMNPDSLLVEAAPQTAMSNGQGGQGLLFWVMTVLALGGWGFGLMQRRQIAGMQQQVLDAQQNARKEAEQAQDGLRQQLVQLENNYHAQGEELSALKTKYAQLAQENVALKSTQQPPAQQEPVTPVASGLTRFLYAPTSEGIFYLKNVLDAPNSDTFYQLVLKEPNAQEGELTLICKEENLSRMDAVPQTLLAACELNGKGKMPYTITAANLQSGRVRREGEAWKVVDKIKISW